MLGTRLADRYDILEELGHGGMGVVYRAHDSVLSRDVALKLVPSGTLIPEVEERFRREAQLVAQMDHPAIVPIYDMGRDERTGSLFFVMPVVQGTTLRSRLGERRVSLGETLDIVIQTADALAYSHAHGVIHRDIKPENLMVAVQPGEVRVRVMDFGLAKSSRAGKKITQGGLVMGTLSYLSPEQVTADVELDGRTDTYSLGVVLYECLVGEIPFEGEVQSVLYRILEDVPASPRMLGIAIDEELDQLVCRCLEKRRELRPQRVEELGEELRRYRARMHDSDRHSIVTAAPDAVKPPRAPVLPFVGRRKEYAELKHRLNMAEGGECHLAMVSGEVGVGKTRLLQELETLAVARGLRVLKGRFIELDQQFPYQGYCDLIQDYFRNRDSKAGRVVDLTDLAAELIGLFPILSEIPELRALSQTDMRPGIGRKAEDRTAIYELLARTFSRLAGGKPLVLFLENLHLAEISNEALQYIVRRLGNTPTLVVGTYRTEEVDRKHSLTRLLDSFRGDARFALVLLKPFAEADHRILVASLLGGGGLTDLLAQRLFATSEGNPFFTKELVRSLRETNGIARDPNGIWNLSGTGHMKERALPDTVQQAVERRVQKLEAPLKEILGVASVLGRSFDVRDLAALVDATDLDDSLDRLVDEGLIEEERESRGKRLTFTSSLVRDVLYAALPRRKRKTLHRTCGEQLEARNAGRLDRALATLLYHYVQADVAEKAVPYALLSSRKALEAFSLDDAVRAARTALDFLVDVGREVDAAQEVEARLLLAAALRAMGNLDEALAEAEKVASVCGDDARLAEQKVKALVQVAETAWEALRTEEAQRYAEAGMVAARTLGHTESLVRVLSLGATVASLRGEPGVAQAYLEERTRLEATLLAQPQASPPRGGNLVVALANSVRTIDPALSQTVDEDEITACCFETLATVDREGHVLPDLCERIASEDGGCRYVLTIRPGVTFHDGTLLTAHHVKASIERTMTMASTAPPPAFAMLQRPAGGSPDIEVLSEMVLQVRLASPTPNFAALLTHVRTAIVREVAREVASADGASGFSLVGTGPFRMPRSDDRRRVVLPRSESWWRGAPPLLDSLEFRPGMSAEAIASGLRSGEIDVGQDLFPEDLEDVLRDSRLRRGLVEVPKKATFFVLFNSFSPLGGNVALREALAGSIDPRALVWQTLGSFSQPALGLIPPGILGHDPGRRRVSFRGEEALERLRAAGLTTPIELRVSLHPGFREHFRTLASALFDLWAGLGIRVSVATPTLESYLMSFSQNSDIDVLIGRWNADYADPDNFSYDLFHSRHGVLRAYYQSPETDRLLEEARMQSQPGVREELFRRFERQLIDSGVLTPLFHDLGYRIAGPRVRNMHLSSHPPFVNYHQVAKVEGSMPAPRVAPRRGIIQVPLAGDVRSLDPARSDTVEADEVIANVIEPLTRVTEGAQIVPWLAREVLSEEGGRRFRFHLREEIRFHDGRRFTARDVRYTFEQLVKSPSAGIAWLMSRIRGAKALAEGRSAELAGLKIASPTELTIELEEPLVIFPTLLSHPATGIMPEGSDPIGTSWKEGYVGTGPFQLISYEPGRRIELEANPAYWRPGLPRCEGLVFHLKVPHDEIAPGLRSGRFAIASDLRPDEVEALCRDSVFGPRHRQKPLLCTYLLAANSRRGLLANREIRRQLFAGIDVVGLVGRHLGRVAIPATNLIPPGILPRRRSDVPHRPMPQGRTTMAATRLVANVHPIFEGEYGPLADELFTTLAANGFRTDHAVRTIAEYMEAHPTGGADLLLGRWVGDYPDPDTFASILHTRSGFLGPYCGSEELDALIERGGSEQDPATRRAIYVKLEEHIREEALVLPLFHEQLYRFVRPEVRGLELTFTSPNVRYELLSFDG